MKIKIALNNGYSLVAEESSDPSFPVEIHVGIEKEQCYVQDLALIQTSAGGNRNSAQATCEHGFNVFVYANEQVEEYTNAFHIKLYKEEATQS